MKKSIHVHRKYTRLACTRPGPDPGPSACKMCILPMYMYRFLYVFVCTRSIEQMGCINNPLSELNFQPSATLTRSLFCNLSLATLAWQLWLSNFSLAILAQHPPARHFSSAIPAQLFLLSNFSLAILAWQL